MAYFYDLKERVKEIGPVKMVSIILGCLAGLLYMIGLLEQAFSTKVISGQTSFTIDPFQAFGTALSTPATFGLLFAVIMIVTVFSLMYGISQKKVGKNDPTDTLGSSKFMSDTEVKAVFDWERDVRKIKGPILGSYKGKFIAPPTDEREFKYSMPNRNIIMFGVPGAGKTTANIDPMVIQAFKRGESVVVTDVKGDVYEATFTIAMHFGYKVFVFNTDDCSNSDGWNILAGIGTDINLAQEMARCILKNTLDVEAKDPEQYFEDGMFNLLTALILYINHEAIVAKRDCEESGTPFDDDPFDGFGTIGRLYDILLGMIYEDANIDIRPDKYGNRKEITTYDKIRSLFKDTEPNGDGNEIHPAYRTWQVFESTQAKNRENFVASLGTRLRMLQDREARIMLGKNDIDLTLPAREKAIIYVNKPEGDSTHTMMTASFFSMMFFSLTKIAGRSPGRKLPIRVNMILDEFPNIGKIPNFERKPATVRSQGINLVISVQTLSQLKRMYPNEEWVSIKAMCGISMLLAAGDDNVTTEEFSRSVGKTTVKTEQTRIQRSTFNPFELVGSYAEGVGEQQTDLMKSDEIRRMRLDQTLVITKFHPIILDKILYTDLPEAKWSFRTNINEHKANLLKYAYLSDEDRTSFASDYISAGEGEIGYYKKDDLQGESACNDQSGLECMMNNEFAEDNDYICASAANDEGSFETDERPNDLKGVQNEAIEDDDGPEAFDDMKFFY